MVFTEDDAVESVPWRPPPRPQRSRARVPVPAPVALPAARCDNEREGPSRSIGLATDGALEDGCRIASTGPGYVAVNKHAWGTDLMVAVLQAAAATVAQQFPAGAPTVIGALSAEGGGTLRPHRSHQSGRDVDVGYFRTGQKSARRFEPTDSGNFDPEKTWALLEAILYSADVTFVFLDYELQAVLYDGLVEVGWSEAALGMLFQYPAGRDVPRGVIRHARGHADHFHVRFRCPAADKPDCVD